MKFDVVLANPPYGNNGALAVKFLNKLAELSDALYLVMPKSIKKVSRMNRVTTDLQLIHTEDLPDGTFPDGIGAVRQTWMNTGIKREKLEVLRTHPDFDFVSREESNLCVCRCGSSAGISFTSYEKRSDNTHFMLRVRDQSVVENLVSIQSELQAAGRSASNGIPSLARHDLIAIYRRHFG